MVSPTIQGQRSVAPSWPQDAEPILCRCRAWRRGLLSDHRDHVAEFEREVDPTGTLPPAERAARAERARRAYMLTLAARSAAVRRKKTGPTNETSGPVTTGGTRDANRQS